MKKHLCSLTVLLGIAGCAFLILPAIYAPFIANGRPLLVWEANQISFPFLKSFFAPDSNEKFIEIIFNFTALFLPISLIIYFLLKKQLLLRKIILIISFIALLIPFVTTQSTMDKKDYRQIAQSNPKAITIFAPIKYGPFEIVAPPYSQPNAKHILGCDEIGRSVISRLIYGARASLAAGIISTLIAIIIGTTVGLMTGYFGGKFDLITMRIVEILMCFPSFLLLLILMSMLGDRKFEQSILIVIAVLSITGWMGLAFLVRGETLKQKSLPYIESCKTAGIPQYRTLFVHLLPNIVNPIIISFSFGIAGAILSESSLSFLGFGVQAPTASWGALLRQAFDNPLDHWHLTTFPGLTLFIAIMSFNFIGEGLRKALSPKE
jgi:peptide/nickel transport system permease protein